MSERQAFEESLRKEVRGEIAFDDVSRGIYATDASHYQVLPRCVVTPRNQGDAVSAIRIACRHGVPITARGGGTSLSGQTTWHGMVLDVSRHMASVLEVNPTERWARVEPGVVRDQLNRQLVAHDLQFAPDPATSSRATVGGMIGNNSSGTRSVVYGKTIDHVLECTVALADGTVLTLKPTDEQLWSTIETGEDRAAEIHAGVRKIVESNYEEIQKRFPKVMRRVSGYNLDAFLPSDQGGQPGDWNLTHLIVGSEGTLGVLLEAKLNLVALPRASSVCVVHFDDLFDSLDAVQHFLVHLPSAVELLDRKVVSESRENPTTKALSGIFEGDPAAVLIVEFSDDDDELVDARMDRFVGECKRNDRGYAHPIRNVPVGKQEVWELRKLGLGLIENKPGKKGKACIEDACVPVEVLADYIRDVFEVCDRHGVGLITYAHASVGVLHVRPELDLREADDVRKMKEITDEVFELVVRYGGSFSSEHGDGLVRGEFVPRFFGPQLYEAFKQIKRLFDPQDLMNPGKIVDSAPMTENLRYGAEYQTATVQSHFHYRDHGNMQAAVEQCSGVGACRKLGAGTMCPSYMATRDEQHSTRGRANALRMAMSGQLGEEDVTSDRVAEVLELCLACKACKTECPTSVDVARFKSDVLQMRYDKLGTPRSAKLVAGLPQFLQRIPLPLAKGASWIQRKLGLDSAVKRMLGFDERRALPVVAAKSFETWYAEYLASNHHDFHPHGKVVLFVDTFTNFFEPQIGKAAVRLLESCGYEVLTTSAGCCQRTAISKGLLHQAKEAGAKTVANLAEFEPDLPVVVLEPSCASALGDDLPDLLDDPTAAAQVQSRLLLLEQFLDQELQAGRLEGVVFSSTASTMQIHIHCHQKALYGTDSLERLLNRVPRLEWDIIQAGCCGMAGSFGFEHYEVSQQVGEDRLFPAIRERSSGTDVAATGTSCRQQIRDFLDVDAKHWCELVHAKIAKRR